MKYIISLLLLFASFKSFACPCQPLGKINDEQYNKYDFIVKGKIAFTVTKGYIKYIVVNVSKSYKGKVKAQKITIITSAVDGLCGIDASEGEDWLFFGSKIEGSYSTDPCTRTKKVHQKAGDPAGEEIKDDLKYLEKKLKTSKKREAITE